VALSLINAAQLGGLLKCPGGLRKGKAQTGYEVVQRWNNNIVPERATVNKDISLLLVETAKSQEAGTGSGERYLLPNQR